MRDIQVFNHTEFGELSVLSLIIGNIFLQQNVPECWAM